MRQGYSVLATVVTSVSVETWHKAPDGRLYSQGGSEGHAGRVSYPTVLVWFRGAPCERVCDDAVSPRVVEDEVGETVD